MALPCRPPDLLPERLEPGNPDLYTFGVRLNGTLQSCVRIQFRVFRRLIVLLLRQIFLNGILIMELIFFCIHHPQYLIERIIHSIFCMHHSRFMHLLYVCHEENAICNIKFFLYFRKSLVLCRDKNRLNIRYRRCNGNCKYTTK